MKIFYRIVSIFLALFTVSAYSSNTGLVCSPKTGEDLIIIKFNETKKFGKFLNCINADFISDLTPCAPENGYGLSAPTGTVPLTSVVFDWRDYGSHHGGVVTHWLSSSKISFEGGFMSKDNGYEKEWEFVIDRYTGKAILSIFTGNENMKKKYSCSKKSPLF